MILRTLSLQIGERGLPPAYKYSFKRASRFICNYVERNVLKTLEYTTDGFDRIVIDLCSKPAPMPKVNGFDAACVELDFPQDQIDSSSGRELTMLQIGFLKEGIEKCSSVYPVPREQMIQGLDRFVENGMRNEWVQKTRSFDKEGIVASLACRMTQVLFDLRLIVSHRGETIFDDVILETGPDEILFAPKLKDVVMQGEHLVVREKNGKPLWKRPLAELMGQG